MRRRDELNDKGVQIRFAGRRDWRVPRRVLKRMDESIELTKDNTRMVMTMAFNYGGRAEIVDAVRALVAEGTPAHKIDEKTIRRHLYFPDMPDPDLVIRTSGETRISNFLLWEIAYSELVFPEILWPDMRRRHLYEAMHRVPAPRPALRRRLLREPWAARMGAPCAPDAAGGESPTDRRGGGDRPAHGLRRHRRPGGPVGAGAAIVALRHRRPGRRRATSSTGAIRTGRPPRRGPPGPGGRQPGGRPGRRGPPGHRRGGQAGRAVLPARPARADPARADPARAIRPEPIRPGAITRQ